MKRNLLVGLGAAVLSWLLLCGSVLTWLSLTRSGHLARDQRVLSQDYSAVQKQYGDPLELLEGARAAYEFGIVPGICIVTGLFAGFAGYQRGGWIAVVALVPLQLFLVAADSFSAWAFVRAAIYLPLAYLAGTLVYRARARTASSATSA